MAKGIEYILSVIDRATAPLQKVLGNLDKVEQSFAAATNNEISVAVEDLATPQIAAITSKVEGVKDKAIDLAINDEATPTVTAISQRIEAIDDKVTTITARDFATEKTQSISSRIAGIKDKVVNFSARDTVSPVFNRITNAANNLRTRAGAAFDQVSQKIRAARAEANNLNNSVSKISFGSVFRSLGGPMIAAGLTAGALFGGALSKGMENDLQKTNITTLMRGDVEKANQLFSQLSDYSIKTPYEKADIIDGQKTMMSFGLSSEYAFGKLKNIGDIAMGDAQKMQSLSLAFSQATSAGKLQGQDLLQMINAGFNPLQAISERTGESMVSLRERMEKGGISAAELGRAFEMATDKQGLFYQGAEKASQTFAGKVSNIKDMISEKLIGIYEEMKPVLIPAMEALGTVVEKVGNLFIGAFRMARTSIGWVWDKFKEGNPIMLVAGAIITGLVGQFVIMKTISLGVAAAKMIWAGAQWALNVAMNANPVSLIIAGIIALIALIAYVIYRYDGWGEAWDNLVKFLTSVWDGFLAGFTVAWKETEYFFLTGIDKLKAAWYSLKSLWDEDGANAGMAQITANQQAHIDGINAAKEAEKNAFDKAAQALDGIRLKDSGKSLKDVGESFKSVLGIKATGGSTSEKFDEIKPPKTNGSVKEAAGAGAGKAKGINEGGSRPTTINITIQKLQDQIVINAGSVKEGAKQAANDVVNELLLALNSVDAKGGLSYD